MNQNLTFIASVLAYYITQAVFCQLLRIRTIDIKEK